VREGPTPSDQGAKVLRALADACCVALRQGNGVGGMDAASITQSNGKEKPL